MKVYSGTANSSTTIGYTRYGYASWNTGSSSGACQGAYENTASSGSRVGVMVFEGAGAALKGRRITQIEFAITCSNAGYASSSKVLTFHKANYQSLDTSLRGSAQVGDTLGTLTGKFYGNTSYHTLNESTNAAFFNAMIEYLAAGNSVLVLYNGETSGSGTGDYSTNYARITSIIMTVAYMDAKTIWYNNGGTWVECYAYYRQGGQWVLCSPYYNSGGTWV